MKKVGVKFKPAGKVYDFDCGAFVLKRGDQVIVETEKGLGFAIVVVPPVSCENQPVDRLLKKMSRLANEEDFRQQEKNLELEKEAYNYCKKSIRELGLSMNLFCVESTFDSSRLTFFFTAEGRVDFRQLVKTLVKQFRTRIEMRQVGIRNQAKMCGGIGRCGREICCSAFIDKFEPVSIRMAKEQSLSLNPTKISGLCGRLMCCLNYENDFYQSLKSRSLRMESMVDTPDDKGKVVQHNIIGNRTTVRPENDAEIEMDPNNVSREEKE